MLRLFLFCLFCFKLPADGHFAGMEEISSYQKSDLLVSSAFKPREGKQMISMASDRAINILGTKHGFDPVKDVPAFLNFYSQNADGSLNQGTCFGISYFTGIWYTRIVQPMLNGNMPMEERFDGPARIASRFQLQPQGLDFLRLRSLSGTATVSDIKSACVLHQKDQHRIEKIDWDSQDPEDLKQKVRQLKLFLNRHGNMLFYFHRFEPKERFYQWSQWKFGHACLMYRISEVEVELGSQKEKAWKLDFIDPNYEYKNPALIETGEGFGTYLLYFPRQGLLSFSRFMQHHYQLQKNTTMVDRKEIRLGLFDVHENHPVQQSLSRFSVGRLGRELSEKEARALAGGRLTSLSGTSQD